MPHVDSTKRFIELTRTFCRWCEDPKTADAAVLRREALEFVAKLYAGVLDLPAAARDDYPGTPEVSKATIATVNRSFAALPFSYYRGVLDPSFEAKEEFVTGDLADDLTDIYSDLKGGLLVLDDGNGDDAVWHWVWTYRVHWGAHAANALQALHTYGSSL
jgi:hypothetical protein